MRSLFSTRSLIGAATAGILAVSTLGAVAGSHEKSSGHPGVDARHMLMKEISTDLKVIKAYVAGESSDLAAVEASAESIAVASAKIDGAFQDQIHVENANGVTTTASPAIWQKWDEFSAIADDMETAANALAMTAAAGGDADAVKAGFGGIAKNCGACHKPFRVKKN